MSSTCVPIQLEVRKLLVGGSGNSAPTTPSIFEEGIVLIWKYWFGQFQLDVYFLPLLVIPEIFHLLTAVQGWISWGCAVRSYDVESRARILWANERLRALILTKYKKNRQPLSLYVYINPKSLYYAAWKLPWRPLYQAVQDAMSLKILSNKTLIRTSIISHFRAQKNCF